MTGVEMMLIGFALLCVGAGGPLVLIGLLLCLANGSWEALS